MHSDNVIELQEHVRCWGERNKRFPLFYGPLFTFVGRLGSRSGAGAKFVHQYGCTCTRAISGEVGTLAVWSWGLVVSARVDRVLVMCVAIIYAHYTLELSNRLWRDNNWLFCESKQFKGSWVRKHLEKHAMRHAPASCPFSGEMITSRFHTFQSLIPPFLLSAFFLGSPR
jgi:hypothetical protein